MINLICVGFKFTKLITDPDFPLTQFGGFLNFFFFYKFYLDC